jgi:hypothetical protein
MARTPKTTRGDKETFVRWTAAAAKLLMGRKVVHVRYLEQEEMDDLDWYGSTLVITFDNGLSIFASQDDEGNGPGALFTTDEKLSTIPVI